MAEVDLGPPGWWPVDKIIVGYLSITGLLILAYANRIPGAATLIASHAAGVLLVVIAIMRPVWLTFFFRHWYSLPYVGVCYLEMRILIVSLRTGDADDALARLDFSIWGAHPTVWLERIQTPALTEFLQWNYSMFVPCVLLIAALLWRRRAFREFRYYAFLIAIGFLVSYIGYFFVPARGPRFLLAHLQHTQLRGLWMFGPLQATLDRLEQAHYDCFPSGHTELTMLAWWGSRMISATLFRVYFVYTLCIIFATVYLRYHYTVDVLAGVVVALLIVWAAPHLYQALESRAFGKG